MVSVVVYAFNDTTGGQGGRGGEALIITHAIVIDPLTSHMNDAKTERYAEVSLAQAAFHKDLPAIIVVLTLGWLRQRICHEFIRHSCSPSIAHSADMPILPVLRGRSTSMGFNLRPRVYLMPRHTKILKIPLRGILCIICVPDGA